MKLKKLLLFIFLFFFFNLGSWGQGEGNIWFFGAYAGLDFNSGSPVPLTVGALISNEGCATISDPSGSLLFYTDGVYVWNRLHTLMPNGSGLDGDQSSSQSAIIVPKPGSSTIYYIFTTTNEGGSNGLRYSEVDMTLDAGLGDVTATKNIAMYTPVTEKLTAVKNTDGLSIWVIAHDNTTADFLAYSVTTAGVSMTPVVSTTGTIDASTFGIGYMKASPDGTKLASALTYSGKVDILNFDPSTGVVTLDFGFPMPAVPYGVEFSFDGSRLYLSSIVGPFVYQYDMTLGTSTAILASETEIRSTALHGMGAIQRAPDKKIYIVRNDDSLDCITYPDLLVPGCGFVPAALSLAGRVGIIGLPNFISGILTGVPIQYQDICIGDSTRFSLTDSLAVDSIHWNFGDPASGINNDAYTYYASHIFSSEGTYDVSVVTYRGYTIDTMHASVIIIGPPSIFIGNDTSICAGDSLMLSVDDGYSYVWQDGSTNRTFLVTSPGTYYVNVSGTCRTVSDTIQVTNIPLPPIHVTDTSICSGQTVSLIATGADNYLWPAGVTATDSIAPVNPITTTNYIVTGISEGCSASDTATVIVYALPVVTANSLTICTGNDATITATGAASYVWSTTDTTVSIHVVPTTTTTYTVTGTSAEGCVDTAMSTVAVSTPPVIALSPDATIVAGASTNLSASGGTGYQWSPSLGLSCTNCANPVASPLQTTTYCVIVDNHLCAAMACLTVNVEMPCPDVPELQVPDAFSPNNDGNNDLFLIQGWSGCIKDFSIAIYDRWGEKVFESKDVNFIWDGTYKNKIMDPAVFVYYLTGKLMNDTPIERKGNITLIR